MNFQKFDAAAVALELDGRCYAPIHDLNDKNRCRVCGLDQEEPPWGEYGDCPNYDICHCCGSESGNDDYTIEFCREYRKNWLSKGAKWFSPKYKPANWSLEEQLKHIPPKYL